MKRFEYKYMNPLEMAAGPGLSRSTSPDFCYPSTSTAKVVLDYEGFDEFGWYPYWNGGSNLFFCGSQMVLHERYGAEVLRNSRGADRYHIILDEIHCATESYSYGPWLGRHIGEEVTMGNERFFVRDDPPVDTVIEEPSVLLSHLWHWNYAHMLLETTSRLWAFEAHPSLKEMPIYLDIVTPYQEQWVTMFLPWAKDIRPHTNRMRFSGKLHVPGFISQIGCSQKQIVWLREFFNSNMPGPRDQLYYITRKNAKDRSVGNEPEVIDYLIGRGFVPMDTAELSLLDQRMLFARAKMVVMPHGAAAANMLFAQPGATLIEFLPESYQHHMYQHICKWSGQKYGKIICNDVGPRKVMDVPMDALKDALEALL